MAHGAVAEVPGHSDILPTVREAILGPEFHAAAVHTRKETHGRRKAKIIPVL